MPSFLIDRDPPGTVTGSTVVTSESLRHAVEALDRMPTTSGLWLVSDRMLSVMAPMAGMKGHRWRYDRANLLASQFVFPPPHRLVNP